MKITLTNEVGRVNITVIHLEGRLDAHTYHTLIEKTRDAYKAGARDFLIDLSDLTYISSAGLVALYTIAKIANGEPLPDEESGWSAGRPGERKNREGVQEHVKLCNPRAEVKSVLDMVGFGSAFEIFTDVDQAVKSF